MRDAVAMNPRLVEKLDSASYTILDQILLNVEISYFIVDPSPRIFVINDESVDEFATLFAFPVLPQDVEKEQKFTRIPQVVDVNRLVGKIEPYEVDKVDN